MDLIQDLTPINLEEERVKFFDSNFTYNPQFKYEKLITLDRLIKYGFPKPEYLELANDLLSRALHNQTESDILKKEGKIVKKNESKKMLQKFIETNRLEKQLTITWIKNHISKASVHKNEVKLRDEMEMEEKRFLALIYHELGTHIIRRINYSQQPFFKKRKEFGFKDYLCTEEGLACLNSLVAKNFKIDYYHALTYIMTDFALGHSFAETFYQYNQYLHDTQRSWKSTATIKRGLYDTSQNGAITKSIIYLEGMVKVFRFFHQSNFDLEGIYLGKIDVEDVEKARNMNPRFSPILPDFISSNRDHYITEINTIAKLNNFDQLL